MPPELPGQIDFEGGEEPERVPWLVGVGEPDEDGNVLIYASRDPSRWIKFGLTPNGKELIGVDHQGFLEDAEYKQALQRAAAILRQARETGRFKKREVPPVTRDQQEL